MSNYEKMYYNLFNQVTDTIEILKKTVAVLQESQKETEITFIDDDNSNLSIGYESR